MKDLKLNVGDMEAFKTKMDELGVVKTQPNYHEPIFALLGLDVVSNAGVPKDEAWMLNKEGKIVQKFKL